MLSEKLQLPKSEVYNKINKPLTEQRNASKNEWKEKLSNVTSRFEAWRYEFEHVSKQIDWKSVV